MYSQQWLFLYLDSTTTKIITLLPELSIWKLTALAVVYKDDPRSKQLWSLAEKEFQKKQHQQLKDYEVQLWHTVDCYLRERHRTLVWVFNVAYGISEAAARAITALKKRSMRVLLTSPETSTLAEFSRA
jgi:hypothetical protein